MRQGSTNEVSGAARHPVEKYSYHGLSSPPVTTPLLFRTAGSLQAV